MTGQALWLHMSIVGYRVLFPQIGIQPGLLSQRLQCKPGGKGN
jgi:hypothetical protein